MSAATVGPVGPLLPTPGQTIGPFFGYALPVACGAELVRPGQPNAISLHGKVFDGYGKPVPDALLELWQVDEQGRLPRQAGSLVRDGWGFTGWGRTPTNRAGEYRFTTVAPGRTEPTKPAFFAMAVFARGLLDRLFTRCYLPASDLSADPLLATLPADRRSTLVARRDDDGYEFDLVLQGHGNRGETVFLSYESR